MKKNVFEIALISLIILLLYSCEYEPKGVYNQPVDKDIPPPQIQVVELNLNSDNIYLYSSMNVKFLFNTDNQKIKATKFLIDGIEKRIIDSNKGEFYIWTIELSEGSHEMVMEIYTESGTGSIADKIGAEGFVLQKSWDLYIDKSYHPEVKALAIDGLLNITWTPYRATNFIEYVVYKYDDMGSEKVVSSSQSNEYVDGTYVGEGGEYIVKVLTSDNSYFTLGYLIMRPEIPKLNFSCDSANQAKVKWGRGNYYNAVDSFVVYMGSSSVNYKRVKATNKSYDTVYQNSSGCFGDQLYFKIRVVPKKGNFNYVSRLYSNYESWIYPRLGQLLRSRPNMNEISHASEDEFIYITNCDSIIRYSVSQRKVVEKLGHRTPGFYCCEVMSLRVSPSGKFLTSRVGCYFDALFTFSDQMNPYSSKDLDYLFGNSTVGIPVSDIGTGLFHDCNRSISVYDFLTSSVIGTYHGNSYCPYGLKFSSNGDYFFAKDDSLKLIRFKDLQFKTIWKVPSSNNYTFYDFNRVNANQVIFLNGYTLTVKQCDNLETVREINLTEKLLDIDYYKNEILTYRTGHLSVRSFTDGSFIKDIPINFTPTGYSACYLINHTILSADGLLYFFN